jgi:hypothetical protein
LIRDLFSALGGEGKQPCQAFGGLASVRGARPLAPDNPIRITDLRGNRCPKDFCSTITLTCIRITLPALGKSKFDAKKVRPADEQSFVASAKSQIDANNLFLDATKQEFATN